ncbi:hypothetical protein [uncultured Cohaesibacter sp.]|uniref:hypothetical protein n=1 Tax=uncultured Cohaesibacter sp. TaxID=1002546 RepID=UPI0029C63AD8|nr:hypothetical protein [uncultured Cohaesibacter sp.]
MNSKLGQSHHQKAKKRHVVLAASLMMTVWAGAADAAEVLAKVTSVGEAGKVELQLPDGAVVMVGDKVRLEAFVSGEDPAAIKTRWTIKAINGSVIEASPDGEPTSSPEVGYQAVINTIAEQPITESEAAKEETAEESAEATEPVAADASETASEAEPEMKAEMAESETSEPEMKAEDVASAETAKEDDAKAEDTPELRPALPSEVTEEKPASEVGGAVVVEAPEPSMDKLKEVEEAAEMPAKGEGEQATPSSEAAPETTADEATVEPTVVAKDPSAVTECDTLTAHPFDPEAVSAGVEYEQLDADKVIAACEQAIADLPEVARFYTQLTRGLHKAKRYDEAFKATEKGAELGSAHSMAFLGVMYAQGRTVAKDDAKSLEWYEKAAEKGNPGGMIFAAAMYRDGVGTERNYQRAVELYRMAADLEVAEAMTSLAIFLDRGLGVEKNVEEATSLLLQAYRLKDLEARKLLFEAPGAISQDMRKEIQTRLKTDGFYKSAIDGEFGPGTRNALVLYGRSAN